MLCPPERIRTIHDTLAHRFGEAGIAVHSGKTKASNKAGIQLPEIAELGGEEGAWRLDGIILLGTPIGTHAFTRDHAAARLREEQFFLDQLSALPDPQCAWQLFTRYAIPRGNYWLRTIPFPASLAYARSRDDAIWQSVLTISRTESMPTNLKADGRKIAKLPSRMGGLGVRSAVLTAPAA